MVKIGRLAVNPYDVDEFIINNKGDMCEAIISFKSGAADQVVLEGTFEQCESLFSSDVCQQIREHNLMLKTRNPRVHTG